MEGFWQRGLWVCYWSCILWERQEVASPSPLVHERGLGREAREHAGCPGARGRLGWVRRGLRNRKASGSEGTEVRSPSCHTGTLLRQSKPKEELDPGDLMPPGRYSWLTSPPSPPSANALPFAGSAVKRVPCRNLQGSVPEENNQFRTSANSEKVSMSYQFPDGKKSKSGCARPSLVSPFL